MQLDMGFSKNGSLLVNYSLYDTFHTQLSTEAQLQRGGASSLCRVKEMRLSLNSKVNMYITIPYIATNHQLD